MRFPFLLAVSLFTALSGSLLAAEGLRTAGTQPQGDYHVFLDDPLPHPHVTPVRPHETDKNVIESNTKLIIGEGDKGTGGDEKQKNASSKTIDTCLTVLPYDHRSVTDHIGQGARVMANNTAASIEAFTFQPHFSGLMGPNITIMRKDLERAMINNQGSANEIFHNAQIKPTMRRTCDKGFHDDFDVTILHHIDAWDSDEAPLVRSDAILNERLSFGGYFMATTSARYSLYDNLEKEEDLQYLNTYTPTRQDYLGYAWQGFNLERMMISGFFTPTENLYLGLHAGFIEEMFFGTGGEMLYRPYDSPFAIGGEMWRVTKRIPYIGSPMSIDQDNQKNSALVNLWYDLPETPLSFGLSGGKFLDGDAGYQLRTRYTPAPGWMVEGYTTYSNQTDESLNDDDPTHWMIGARLTMPLGAVKALPDNSRQIVAFEPMARDHGQRIDNPYPLYDLTDPWQARNLYRYWSKLTE